MRPTWWSDGPVRSWAREVSPERWGHLDWRPPPKILPELLALPTGPAIYHGADMSPVTADKPARAGEPLIMSVSGPGPVNPNLNPGKPLPHNPEGKLH